MAVSLHGQRIRAINYRRKDGQPISASDWQAFDKDYGKGLSWKDSSGNTYSLEAAPNGMYGLAVGRLAAKKRATSVTFANADL